MGVTESVSAVMWARRRQPGEIAYGIALGMSGSARANYSTRRLRPDGPDSTSSPAAITWPRGGIPAGGPPAHCAKDGGGANHHRQAAAMGATAIVMMNVSGAEPLGTIRLYGDRVLPALRG